MNEQNGHIPLNAGDTVLDIPATNNNIDGMYLVHYNPTWYMYSLLDCFFLAKFAGVNSYFNKDAQQEKIAVIDIGKQTQDIVLIMFELSII